MPEVLDQPTTTEAPASTPTVVPPINTPFADIDRLFDEAATQNDTPTVTGQRPKEAPSPVPKPQKADPNLDKGKTETPATEKPAEKTAEKPKSGPAELRAAYENSKAKLKEYESKIKEYEEKLKAPPPPKDDPEKKELSERLTKREQRLKELEETLRNKAFEESEEFKTKFHKPFVDAYTTARAKVSALTITDAEGNSRRATPEDFDAIARMTNDDEAGEKAAELFGSKASIVLYHRERVQELNMARHTALEEWKKNASEREIQEKELNAKRQSEFKSLWEKKNNEVREKYKDWFSEQEGDEEGNKLLKDGYDIVDRAYSDDANMTQEERIDAHAAVRNRAAGFGRLAYRYVSLQKENAQLKKELEAFKASVPKPGDKDGQDVSVESDDPFDAIDKKIDAIALPS